MIRTKPQYIRTYNPRREAYQEAMMQALVFGALDYTVDAANRERVKLFDGKNRLKKVYLKK